MQCSDQNQSSPCVYTALLPCISVAFHSLLARHVARQADLQSDERARVRSTAAHRALDAQRHRRLDTPTPVPLANRPAAEREPAAAGRATREAHRTAQLPPEAVHQQTSHALQRQRADTEVRRRISTSTPKRFYSIDSTLNYVRKCSQHFDMSTVDEESIDPAKWFEESNSGKLTRRRLSHTSTAKSKRPTSVQASQPAINPVADVFLQHNRKHIETIRSASAKKPAAPPPPAKPDDDDARRHVQFQVTLERNSQSAYASRKANASSPLSSSSSASSDNKQPRRKVTSAHGLRTDPISPTDSAPVLKAVDQIEVHASPIIHQRQRSPARMIATKSSLREFRQHPERFLSKSNRYLPLLQRQASQSRLQKAKPSNSSLADGSDLAYDDARSFLSEEIEAGFVHCPALATRSSCVVARLGKRCLLTITPLE